MALNTLKIHTLKKLALLLLCTATSLFAQEKKYQSLLWEVSGNGLEKKSYLYGSMHVSDKISYHLSDAFFASLLNADIVAGESDPATWHEVSGMLVENYHMGDNAFYSRFYQSPLTRDRMYHLFSGSNYTLNGLLSRTSEMRLEHQEETYLDMFIYRTGKKYNKTVVGLEDAKTSLLTIMKVDPASVRPVETNRVLLQKVLKNTSYQDAMMNYYREKDLDMLDSINSLLLPENYLKALLYDRNIVMVNSIDSLARKGSLFAAVGAAHLPGKKGVIEALRKKGYTVTPVFDTYTQKGLDQKQEIESYFIKPILKNYNSPDGTLSIPMFPLVMENRNSIESPDLSNGGYITVKRTLLADFLKKDNKPFDHKSLDSLFYENIQGRILEKKFYNENGFQVYDIKSTTKTGNAQRYRYYITPLEIIAVIMAGEGNYVRQFENEVYNNIVLKAPGGTWSQASPKRGGFTVQLPGGGISYGNLDNPAPEDIEMYGYDDGAYFFLIERTLPSSALEDTRYELQRMHYEYDRSFDSDTTATRFTEKPLAFLSASKIGNRDVRLKSVINGPKYYLMGSVGAGEAKTDTFFSSFTLAPEKFPEDFRTYTDTIGGYSIEVPRKENEKLDFEFNHDGYRDRDEKKNLFAISYGDAEFTLPSGRTIMLNYQLPHRYEQLKPADSAWADIRSRYEYDKKPLENDRAVDSVMAYNDETEYSIPMLGRKGVRPTQWNEQVNRSARKSSRYKIINEKITENKEKGYSRMDFLLVQDNSAQAIKERYYYRNGVMYELSAMVGRDYKNDDPYLEKIFDSVNFFSPAGDTIANLPADKVKLFIEDAKSEHDSIRYSAFASLYYLNIEEPDLKPMMNFIEEFDFSSEASQELYRLYGMISRFKDQSVIPFLEKQYKKEDVTTGEQFAILQALTGQSSKDAYKKIMELLEYDLPLSDQDYLVDSLFGSFSADAENSAALVPDIFQFYSIREYHDPIVSFTASLLEEEAIKPGKLKSIRKMVLTSARLELKRAKSQKSRDEDNEDDYAYIYDEGYRNDASGLTDFMEILYPYRDQKDVKPFFASVKKLDMKSLNLEMARLDIVNGNIDKEALEPMLANPETLFTIYNIDDLKKQNAVKDISDEKLASSAMFVLNSLDEEDTLTLLETRKMDYNDVPVTFYFFRLSTHDEEDETPKTDRVVSVAFVNNTDGSINSYAYRDAGIREITDEDKLEEYKDAMVDIVLSENYSRASGKRNRDRMPYFYDGYGDIDY